MRRILTFVPVLSCAILAFSLTVSAQEAAPAPKPAESPAPAAASAPKPAEAPAPKPAEEPAHAPAPAETPAPTPSEEPAPAPTPVPAEAAAPQPEAAPASAAEAPAPARRTFEMRGMLPLGYRDYVTPEQKDKIYAIQDEYRGKLEELQKQMDALRQEMNQRIEGVLTPEQREKIHARENEIRTRWKAKRTGK